MKTLSAVVTALLLSCSFLTVSAQSSVVPFYIIIGQSNLGWASADELPPDLADVYKVMVPQSEIWNPGRGGWSAGIEPLNIGVNTMCENYADAHQFGPEASLMVKLNKQTQRKRFVYKQGQGGTSLSIDWRPPFANEYEWQAGPRWRQFAGWLALAVSQANQKGYKLDLKGIIWMQGENDGLTSLDANAYYANLCRFFDCVDLMWAGMVNTYNFPQTGYKKVLGRINAPNGITFRDSVRAAEQRYCAVVNNHAILVNCDAYPLQDWIHYNAKAQVQFGLDIFQAANFEDNASTLPIGLGTIKAFKQGTSVDVEWKVDNENDVKSYEIENSPDGRTFRLVGVQMPNANNLGAMQYDWLDVAPLQGNNFYRIKSIKLSGQAYYTQVVKLSFGTSHSYFRVYPVPVVNGVINMQFVDKPKGNYAASIYNSSGQLVFSSAIAHNGGTAIHVALVDQSTYKGPFTLDITASDKTRECIKILFR